jgi:hypothetical protein
MKFDEEVTLKIFQFLSNVHYYKLIHQTSKRLFKIFKNESIWAQIDLSNVGDTSEFLTQQILNSRCLKGLSEYCAMNNIETTSFISKLSHNLEKLDLVSFSFVSKINSDFNFGNIKEICVNHENVLKLKWNESKIEEIHIYNSSNRSLEEIDVISDAPRLKFINLYNYQISDGFMLKKFKKMKSFAKLILWFCDLKIESSESIEISQITFENMNVFKRNPFGVDLKVIKINPWETDPDGTLKNISKNHQNVTSIDASDSCVSDEGIIEMINLKKLKKLKLENCECISPESILKILESNSLNVLNIKNCCQITESDVLYFECFVHIIESSFAETSKNADFFQCQKVEVIFQEQFHKDLTKFFKIIKSEGIESNNQFIFKK